MCFDSYVNGLGNFAKTRTLLVCGVIGGPLFVLVFLIEGATRTHYNPLQQPVSDLAIGEFGWMQVANFVIAGLLFLAFAIGLRRELLPLGGVWGPVVLGLFALGLIGAGIFTGDRHPLLHNLCGIPVFFGLPIACFIFARLFLRLRKTWMGRLLGYYRSCDASDVRSCGDRIWRACRSGRPRWGFPASVDHNWVELDNPTRY
jgi:hypothetical membrane protein